MRIHPLLACAPLMALLAACAEPGYYDDHGNYVPAPNATTDAQRIHAPSPGYRYDPGPEPYAYTTTTYRPAPDHVVQTTTYYDRPGYYDYQGYYIDRGSFSVPADMFPPRGACRVWFPERSLANQPRIETCDGIRQRVPAGAYVIYGG